MSESEEISKQLREFILSHFPAARNKALGDEESLLTSHIIDSMGILDLVLYVEKEFGLTVDEEEFIPENFESIASLTKFVKNKLDRR